MNHKLNVDLTLYDLEKCFDSQWHSETMNDLWDVGITDDRFSLISEMNRKCNIAVKTPVGMSDRFVLSDIEMQGTVLGPIKCSVQLDTLGRDCYERQEGLYLYNGCVSVPPLEMIDDLASFAICGPQSIVTNAIVNAKIESKKLKFGPTKCFNIHVGSDKTSCDGLKVHDQDINEKEYETYLGDIICATGSNQKNIEKRVNLGIGAVSEIISMLRQISLGHFYYEIALILRDSSLVSKMIYSSEIWYGISSDQFTKLEQIDEMYLRNIFEAPKSAPRLGLYIESGKIPLRYIIKARRLLYYWHILHLNENELVYKFFQAQKLKPTKNDWVLEVAQNLQDWRINVSENDVKKISKEIFKKVIDNRMKLSVREDFRKLQEKKGINSKTNKLKINQGFKPSEYLFSRNLCVEEIRTLFRLRTMTVNVKNNSKSSFKNDMWCKTCLLFTETQEHVFMCTAIRSKLDSENFIGLKYEMIFGTLKDQEKFTKVYHLMLKARDDLLKIPPSSDEGPLHL